MIGQVNRDRELQPFWHAGVHRSWNVTQYKVKLDTSGDSHSRRLVLDPSPLSGALLAPHVAPLAHSGSVKRPGALRLLLLSRGWRQHYHDERDFLTAAMMRFPQAGAQLWWARRAGVGTG